MIRRNPATGPPMQDGPDVLIVGASARAAAWSAIRAGLTPVAIDVFGDEDLRAVCDVRIATDFPRDLPSLAASMPDCPWMYTGALENHPKIVRAIAEQRPLWGNDASVLAAVRDPFAVVAVLESAGLPHLAIRGPDDPPPRDGGWVLRPKNGTAGRAIHRWTATCPRQPTFDDVFQRVACGVAHSTVIVADRGRSEVVAVTRQDLGGAGPFEWRGNAGPVDPGREAALVLESVATVLTEAFSLRGLIGVDFVIDGEASRSVPYLTEINPRYTGSVEVCELSLGRSLTAEHAAVFGVSGPPASSTNRRECVTKHVLFAATGFTFERFVGVDEPTVSDPWSTEGVVDRPVAGTSLEVGQPFCTVLGCGSTLVESAESVGRLLNAAVVQTSAGRRPMRELVECVQFDG